MRAKRAETVKGGGSVVPTQENFMDHALQIGLKCDYAL